MVEGFEVGWRVCGWVKQRARPRGWFTIGGARGAVDWVESERGTVGVMGRQDALRGRAKGGDLDRARCGDLIIGLN